MGVCSYLAKELCGKFVDLALDLSALLLCRSTLPLLLDETSSQTLHLCCYLIPLDQETCIHALLPLCLGAFEVGDLCTRQFLLMLEREDLILKVRMFGDGRDELGVELLSLF